MYVKTIVSGKFVYETETHYITKVGKSTVSWHKKWYRLPLEV